MKKTITTTVIALLIGLFLGFFISKQFGNNEKSNVDKQLHSENENQQWTCSMHPQIERDEAGQCPICGMDLIPMKHKKQTDKYVFEMSKEAMKLAEIETLKIGETSANQHQNNSGLSLTGKIQADETKSASIVSHIAGRIEKLYVSFTGESIYSGQKIADVYSPNLITAQKELLEAYKVKDENPRLFEATKNKLKFLKITNLQINNIISSNSIQENFAIYADYSGVVSERLVSVGNHIKEGSVLFKTQNLNKLWVLFDVYEKDLSKIKKGDVIHFTSSASNKKYTTKIIFIDPVINPNTRTASIRGVIYNKNKALKPEMFVSGKIMNSKTTSNTKADDSKIIIPKSAIMWTGKRSVVYVKMPNTEIPSFNYREVELGSSLGSNYEILEGLKKGEEIVVNGAFVIDASIQLKNNQSMMNKKDQPTKKMNTHNH